jgi:hypothetical protein
MKSTFLLLFILFHAIVLFAQVESYTVDASKTYKDNSQINYLTLKGSLDDESREQILVYMDKDVDVIRFSFYDNINPMKCMFKINESLDNDIIIKMMNEAVSQIKEIVISDIPKEEFYMSVELKNAKIIYFEVSGFEDIGAFKNFAEELVQDSKIYSVEIDDSDLFKLKVDKSVNPAYIEDILSKYNAVINCESTKK